MKCAPELQGPCAANGVQNVRKSNIEAVNTQDNIARVFQQVIKGNSELAATQTRHWERSQDLATQLQVSLGEMKDGEVQTILGAFGSIQNQLVGSPL